MTSNPPSPTSSSTSIRASATTLLTTTTTTTTTTTSTSNNSSPLPNKHHCPHCCGRIQSAFDQILSELDMPFITSGEAINHNPGESIHPTKPPPPVSISVFDTESNANVCMCSLYSSSFSIGGEPKRSRSGSINCLDTPSVDVSPQICPNCRNIIKHQPMEHRKTLISRRLMLANDIVVNRIDTTYLHTYTSPTGASSSGTSAVRQFEPYTPESVESHSPVPESVDKLDFDESRTVSPLDQKSPRLEPLDDLKQPPSEEKPPVAATVPNSSKKNNANSTAGNNSNSSCGGVSPRQLKSRLEKLKRISDRRKQYQQSRSANNSGGTLVPGGGTASGDELLALEESGKSSRKELVALGSLEGGGDARVERSDHKLIDWCQRHCCAIL